VDVSDEGLTDKPSGNGRSTTNDDATREGLADRRFRYGDEATDKRVVTASDRSGGKAACDCFFIGRSQPRCEATVAHAAHVAGGEAVDDRPGAEGCHTAGGEGPAHRCGAR